MSSCLRSLGFRVWGLGFRVLGLLGFGVSGGLGSGLRFGVQGSRFSCLHDEKEKA